MSLHDAASASATAFASDITARARAARGARNRGEVRALLCRFKGWKRRKSAFRVAPDSQWVGADREKILKAAAILDSAAQEIERL